jgi:hypothetical protein
MMTKFRPFLSIFDTFNQPVGSFKTIFRPLNILLIAKIFKNLFAHFYSQLREFAPFCKSGTCTFLNLTTPKINPIAHKNA